MKNMQMKSYALKREDLDHNCYLKAGRLMELLYENAMELGSVSSGHDVAVQCVEHQNYRVSLWAYRRLHIYTQILHEGENIMELKLEAVAEKENGDTVVLHQSFMSLYILEESVCRAFVS